MHWGLDLYYMYLQSWVTMQHKSITLIYCSSENSTPRDQFQLEWGCPNGTKYPPRQPIPNRAILPNRARLQTDGQTDGRTG